MKKVLIGWLLLLFFLTPTKMYAVSDDIQIDTRPAGIIGTDDRVKVKDVTLKPYSGVCFIETTFPNGTKSEGSGALINSDVVLTAAHCLYDKKSGELATRVKITVAYNPDAWSQQTYYSKNIQILPNYAQSSTRGMGSDIGTIVLKEEVPNTAYVFPLNTTLAMGDDISFAGYTTTLFNGAMATQQSRVITTINGEIFTHPIDTTPGNSGSPIYNTHDEIVGVAVAAGSKVNYAAKMTDHTIAYLQNVIKNKNYKEWKAIDGNWYLLDCLGNKFTGWQQVDGLWYYLQPSGEMLKGWLKDGGKFYYLDGSGAMKTGWGLIGNLWYYFGTDGVRRTGWQSIAGHWYYLNSEGAMQVGWQQIENHWYYFATDGKMQIGWQKIGDAWYYFASDGVRKTGWLQLEQEWYFLADDGKMVTGWVQSGGEYYFMNEAGKMQKGWIQINGDYYFLNQQNGKMQKGWLELENETYYLSESGKRVVGWMKVPEGIGSYYFDDRSGAMLRNKWVDGYYIGSDGICSYKN